MRYGKLYSTDVDRDPGHLGAQFRKGPGTPGAAAPCIVLNTFRQWHLLSSDHIPACFCRWAGSSTVSESNDNEEDFCKLWGKLYIEEQDKNIFIICGWVLIP